MRVEIQILDSANGIEGVLQLAESDNFPLSLTKKSGDIANLTSRSGTFSSSFNIPSTKENNKLLGSMYHSQTKNSKEYFIKKDSIILVNGNVYQRGKLRIEQIQTKGTYKQFKAVFFGDNSEWIALFKETYLSDIGFDSTVTLNGTDIVNSWTNTSTSDEYVMNYVNRGIDYNFRKRNFARSDSALTFAINNESKITHFEEFNADLFVKQILKKSFNSIGYNFNSSFFDSDASALIHSEISENYQKIDVSDNYAEINSFPTQNYTSGELEPIQTFRTNETGSYVNGVRFGEIDFTTKVSDVGINYDTTANLYTVPREGVYDIEIDVDIEIVSAYLTSSSQTLPYPVSTEMIQPHVVIEKQDVAGQYDLEVVGQWRLWSDNATPVSAMDSVDEIIIDTTLGKQYAKYVIRNAYFLADDKFKFGVAFESLNGSDYSVACTIYSSSQLRITEKTDIVRNNTFNLADVVDSSKHSILNLIQDYTTAFNLYWRTDNLSKTVYCEPRDTFYNALTTAKDWTNKIDISSYSLVPLSSQFNRYLSFNYLQDSNDNYLQEVNKDAVLNYGTYQHDLGANFKDGETGLNMRVYSASLTINKDSNAYSGTNLNDAPSTSRLWNENLIEIPEFNTEFTPRLLNYNYDNSQTIQYEVQNGTKSLSNTSSSPSPCGLFTSDVVTIKKNLHFATINAQNGLFKAHYQKTFDLINNGFVLDIDANLTNTDISNYKLNDIIYFAAPFDLKGYWIIQEIAKIQPLQSTLVSLSLIQHKSFESLVEQVIPDIIIPPIGGEISVRKN